VPLTKRTLHYLQAQAADKANAQNQITLQNENLKQQNYWAAINALSGNAAQVNPLGYSSASTGAANAVTGLSQANTAASGPTFGSILGGVAGGALSGAGQAGGFGKLFGCWCAAATFGGWLDPRTIVVRQWLNTEFIRHWYGRLIMKTYLRFGERVSQSRFLLSLVKPMFFMALEQARS
jgi:hypothetical protein